MQTFHTVDVSYHRLTFRTMDDSCHGFFVPSLDSSYHSYHGLFVPSSDYSHRRRNFTCFHIFSARQHVEHMLSALYAIVRPSVSQFIPQTGGS